MEKSESHRIERHSWGGEGYKPLVSFAGWLVALMNWEKRFDISEVGKVERHNLTDEVFVLVKGRSVLYVVDGSGIEALDMQPGVVYNIPKAMFHNVIGTKDAAWLIVENNDTTSENTDFYTMNAGELQDLISQFPAWLREIHLALK